jgi:hypothetical protein
VLWHFDRPSDGDGIIMPALVAGIHISLAALQQQNVDRARIKSAGDKLGRDSEEMILRTGILFGPLNQQHQFAFR